MQRSFMKRLPPLPGHQNQPQRWLRYAGRALGTLQAALWGVIAIQFAIVGILVLTQALFGIGSLFTESETSLTSVLRGAILFVAMLLLLAGVIVAWWHDGTGALVMTTGSVVYALMMKSKNYQFLTLWVVVILLFLGSWAAGSFYRSKAHGGVKG